MKICWDNLERLKYRGNGIWYGKSYYIEKEYCKTCEQPFLTDKYKPSKFCCLKCSITGKYNPFFNKNHSEKTRKHLSKVRKGRFTGKNNHFYGKTHSIKTRKIISKKTKKRMANKQNNPFSYLDFSGNKNGNWKGGLSAEPYCFVFRTKEWREMIYERDKDKFCWNPQCEGRGSRETLHHIDYDKKNCHPSNIIKICNSCNTVANFNREWWEAFYKVVMERRIGL